MSDAFVSIVDKYSTLWDYDTGTGGLEKLFNKTDPATANPMLIPGKGYWIYMVQEGEIVP